MRPHFYALVNQQWTADTLHIAAFLAAFDGQMKLALKVAPKMHPGA